MDDLYAVAAAELKKLTDYYTAVAADGLSVSEGFSLLTKFAASAVRLVESIGSLPGDVKKQLVADAATKFYDSVIRPLDIPGIPNLIENTVIDPILGRAISPLIGGLIDALVVVFNRTGWGLPDETVTPPVEPTPDLPEGFEPY